LKGSSGDGGGVVLTVCAMICSMLLVIRVNTDRDTLRMECKSDGLGVPELMDVLIKGVGGTDTTKRTPTNEYNGPGDMTVFADKSKFDRRKFVVAAGDVYMLAQTYARLRPSCCKHKPQGRRFGAVI
jgi:hypothetical protein